MTIEVTITTPSGTRRHYAIRATTGTEEHIRGVLSSVIELGCAILDAVYSRTDSETRNDGMGPQ